MQGMPASSAHATGVPGSADKWAWAYALLLCVVMALGSWCNANNQAIVAMARPRSPARLTAELGQLAGRSHCMPYPCARCASTPVAQHMRCCSLDVP